MDAIGAKRYESQSGGEREIQRTMLELLNQMDGFDARGDVKVSNPLSLRTHLFLCALLNSTYSPHRYAPSQIESQGAPCSQSNPVL